LILAGDIGGTKTRLALFEPDGAKPVRLGTYPTAGGCTFLKLVERLLDQVKIDGACFGVAGTVINGRVTGVNLPWPLDAAQLERRLDVPIEIVNDVHANARGIEALDESDFLVLNPGAEGACGNRAVLSAGTGLGEAGLFWDGNRHHGIASEGGHADFAPRTDLEVRLYYHLAAEFGHVSYERICSGPGLRNLYRSLSPDQASAPPAAAISAEALEKPSSLSSRALDLFVSTYGARAGNVALGFMANGGVYLGGGMPPKIIGRLKEGGFMDAFLDKGRFAPLLAQIPVRVILNDQAALLGAAQIAAELRHTASSN